MKRVSALLPIILSLALCGCSSLRGGYVTLTGESSEIPAADLLQIFSSARNDRFTEYLTAKPWYNSENISEEWIFTEDTVSINGVETPYSFRITLLEGRSLVIGEKSYSFRMWDNELDLTNKNGNLILYSADSEDYKRIVREEKISQASAELLERYPDRDGWIQSKNCGDIPLLANADIIDNAMEQGGFIVNTPEDLASACWVVNTMSAAYMPIVINADIDLSGYEWAPMGWNGGKNDHPFNAMVSGNGHTISNMTINSDDSDVGFIGWETFCLVEDIRFDNANVSGRSNVAVVTGQAIGGSYSNITITNSTVTGAGAGSMLGWDANCSKKNCTADVVVNGEQFGFLSYNDKEKSEIVIENPVTITIDEQTHEVTRPEVEGYYNLGWMVFYNGEQVLHRNAEGEYSYTYFLYDPGYYEIYLTAYVQGQYVPISNTVSYTID